MAYRTGVASDHKDMLAQIKQYVEDGSFMLGSGGAWEGLHYDTSGAEHYYVVKTNEPNSPSYMGFFTYTDPVSAEFGIGYRIFSSYPGGTDYSQFPDTSAEKVLPLWDSTMPYWMSVSARRISLVCKVSTVYPSMYLGKGLTFGSEARYPFPVLAAGANVRSWQDSKLVSFAPYVGAQNIYDSPIISLRSMTGNYISPGHTLGQASMSSRKSGIDGSKVLFKFLLTGDGGPYCDLEGVYLCTWLGTSPEDQVTVGSDTYRIFPNAYRTSAGHFWALKEE
jgi:hypothetical protein